MKTSKSFLVLTTLLCFLMSNSILPNTVIAQDNAAVYLTVDFMKVEPKNISEYRKLEKVWKKIHEARIKKGSLMQWSFHEVVAPYGTDADYNFITINAYQGTKMLASLYDSGGMMDGADQLLTAEEMKLAQKTNQLRDIVKQETFRVRGGTTSTSNTPAKVTVVNYMKFNKGYRGPDMAKVENSYWKPVHQARVDRKEMKGWGMYSKEITYGSSMEYNATTADFYDSFEQMMSSWNLEKELKAAKVSKSVDEVLAETEKVRDLVKSEVWMLIDITTVTPTMAEKDK